MSDRTDGWLNRSVASLWNLGHAVADRFRPQNATTPVQLEEIFRRFENGGGVTWSGESVSETRAMQTRAVNSCIGILADTQSMLPLDLLRQDPETGKKTPARDLPLYDLLKTAPNDWQTSFEWREMGVQHLELRGNFYNLIVRDGRSRVIELIPMDARRVEPVQDKTTMAISYRWTRQDGVQIDLAQRDVFHVRGRSTDGIRGVSTISWHRETIGEALAVQRQGGRFWSNAARPMAVLEVSEGADIDEDAQKDLRADFEEMYQGGDNAYKTAILPGGIGFKPLSMSMEDAQFLETRKFGRTEIAGIFRVPPHLIGDLEKATFSNIENLSLQFGVYTITPRCVRWEQAIGRDLVPDPTVFAKHNINALLRGAAKDRAEALQIQKRNGVISPNDWREMEDLNRRDDPGGDRYTIESNMQDDTQATLNAPAATGPREPAAEPSVEPPAEPPAGGPNDNRKLRVVPGRD